MKNKQNAQEDKTAGQQVPETMHSTDRFLLIPACAAGIIFALCVIGRGRTTFSLLIMILVLGFFTLLPAVITIMILDKYREKHKAIRIASSALVCWVVFLILSGIAIFAAPIVRPSNVEPTLRAGEQLALQLEEYRDKHSHYPQSLQELQEAGFKFDWSAVRKLLYFPEKDGTAYKLMLPDPWDPLDWWFYDSKVRKWSD